MHMTGDFKRFLLVINLVIVCTANAVTVQWRPDLNWAQKLDLSKARLGTCPPSSISTDGDVLLFSVWLHDCGFRRQVMLFLSVQFF